MEDKRKIKRNYFKGVSKDQAKDGGMVVVLILLILGLKYKQNVFYASAVITLVVNMLLPVIFKPLVFFMITLAKLIGKIPLSIVYILLIFPMGLLRRLLGKDSLKLREFKKSESSVFRVRDHQFQPADIDNPY